MLKYSENKEINANLVVVTNIPETLCRNFIKFSLENPLFWKFQMIPRPIFCLCESKIINITFITITIEN